MLHSRQPKLSPSLLAFAAAFALVAAEVPAADGSGQGLRIVGRCGRPLAAGVVSVGRHVAVGTDAGLLVVTAEGPLEIEGRLDLVSGVEDLAAIADDLVVLAAGSEGVVVVGVDGEGRARRVATARDDEATAVAALGDVVIAGVTTATGPHLVAFAGPAAAGLRPGARLGLPGPATSIAWGDGVAAVAMAAPPGVLIVEIGDDLTALAFFPTALPAHRVLRTGERLLIACGSPLAGELVSIDLSDPRTPRRIAGMRLGDAAFDVRLLGGRALVATGRIGIVTIDVADDATWQRIATLPSGRSDVALAECGESSLLVSVSRSSTGAATLTRLRADDAGALQATHEMLLAESVGVARRDEDVVVLHRDALEVMAAGVQGTGEVLGRWTRPLADFSRLAVDGNLAAVASGPDVHLVDLSDVAAPRRVDVMSVERGAVTSLAMQDGVLAVAQGRDVELFDVSHPGESMRAGIVEAGAGCVAVGLSGGTLAIAAGDRIVLIDVRSIRHPRVLGEARLATSQHAVVISGDLVAAGSLGGSVTLLDASDPARPGVLSTRTTGPVSGLSLEGTRLVVAETAAGASVFRATPVGSLLREAWIDLPGATCAVALAGGHVDAAATGAGTFHLELEARAQPAAPGAVESPRRATLRRQPEARLPIASSRRLVAAGDPGR